MNLLESENKVKILPSPEWILASDILKMQHPSTTNLMQLETQIHCGLKMRFHRVVRRFETMNSIQNGSVFEFDVNPNHETLFLHHFKIFRQTEEINKLPGINMKLIQKEMRSQNFIFTGIWTLVIILDDIREGDILEYSYSYQEHDPFSKDFFQESLYFDTSTPTQRIFLRLIAPIKKANLKYHGVNQTPIPIVRDLDENFREWIWNIADVKIPPLESYQPSWYSPFSHVQISSLNTWDEVSQYAQGIFVTSTDLSPHIKGQINQWKEAYPDIRELITFIIRFVQKEIRFLSLNENRLSYNSVVDPNQVYMKRFGDCKDKTWLLCLLLKEIGIQSYPALVNTYLKDKIVSFLPSFQFNHAILAIEYEEITYWIDSTLTYQGGQFYTMSQTKFGFALLIGKAGHSLVPIGHCEPESKTASTVTFDVTKNQEPATMHVETKYYNECADNMRALLSQTTLEELTKNYTSYYNRFYSNVSTLQPLFIEDSLDKNVMIIREGYLISNFGVKIKERKQSKYVYSFYPLTLLSNLISKIDVARQSPLGIDESINVQEEIIVRFSKKLKFQPKRIEIKNDNFEYKEHWIKQSNKSHRVIFSIKSLKDHIAVENFSQINDFMDTLTNKSLHFSTNIMSKWVLIGVFFLVWQLLRFLNFR